MPSARQIIGSICGGLASNADATGILTGTVMLQDSVAVPTAVVVADWAARVRGESGATSDTAAGITRRLEVHAAPNGTYRFCGLPVNTTLLLRANAESAATAGDTTLRLPAAARIVHANLVLKPLSALASRSAVFNGVVVTDSTRAPIMGAEVALPELGKSVLTGARGDFRITGIAPGNQHVLVRRLGYGAADAQLMFHANETVERRVVLGRAVMLEPVIVTDVAFERAMASFDEHRRVGLGHFMARAELSPYTGMKLPGVLAQIPGLAVVNGRTSGAWVTSRRAPAALCPGNAAGCLESHGYYVPSAAERFRGVVTACYSLVYIDHVLMNGGHEPTKPYDVSTIPPEQIEAIEYYAGAAETPAEYSRSGSSCGVLVIWTRPE
jgi:hypothetical protein